jgi:hypothetical protein
MVAGIVAGLREHELGFDASAAQQMQNRFQFRLPP